MKYFAFYITLFLSSCNQQSETIKIKGSDTEVNLSVELAESFHTINSKVFVSVSGGGSGLGIASLLNGNADIANSSRSINNKEWLLFQRKNILLDSFIFAQDAIAFVVANDLQIDSISNLDLKNILSGDCNNWKAITGQNRVINIYGRQSNSGTHSFIKKKLKIEFSNTAKEMTGNAQILEAIKNDNSGIGYVGAGYFSGDKNKGLKVLTIYTDQDSTPVSPLDAAMIAQGKYLFQRPLYQYFRSSEYEKIKPFLDFEKSDAGQIIIHQAGLYPVQP